jgi:hypothetical protein
LTRELKLELSRKTAPPAGLRPSPTTRPCRASYLPGILTPKFSPSKQDYTITINDKIESITITGKAASAKATVGDPNGKVQAISMGDNKFSIGVTSKDGKATKAYNFTVEDCTGISYVGAMRFIGPHGEARAWAPVARSGNTATTAVYDWVLTVPKGSGAFIWKFDMIMSTMDTLGNYTSRQVEDPSVRVSFEDTSSTAADEPDIALGLHAPESSRHDHREDKGR